jgi:exodeoxyribonuclease VII large subunit
VTRFKRSFQQQQEESEKRLVTLAHNLHMASPLNTLGRGYALVTTAENGAILQNAADVATGDPINVQLANGRLKCRVEKIEKRKKLL